MSGARGGEALEYTLWARMPGDDRKTAAGWGKPVRVDVTAPQEDLVEAVRQVFDAMKAAGIEMLCARP